MIESRRNKNLLQAFFSLSALIYHSTVREVRKSSGNNAMLGLLNEIATSLLMVGMFWVMYTFLGLKGLTIRGDFMIFLMTGIFLFLTHNKAIGSVMGAANASNPIMKHSPMTTIVSILSSSFAALYLQVLAFVVILTILHILRGNLDIYQPMGLLLPFFLSWASGCTIGLLFMNLKPLAPKAVTMIATIYKRANMITSGKMIPANFMSAKMVAFFDWNPIFHTIDQARGAAFVNYQPRNSDLYKRQWRYFRWLADEPNGLGLLSCGPTTRQRSCGDCRCGSHDLL